MNVIPFTRPVDPDDVLSFARLADTLAHRMRVCNIDKPEVIDALERWADEHGKAAS